MGPIPPDMPQDEYDRRVIEEIKARRAADPNPRTYSSERVSRLLTDLQARFEQAGWADPAIVAELRAQLQAEAPE
jgi:hypothetical protein